MDINDLTIDDIREQRPDLYQEIAKEVLKASEIISDDEIANLIKPLVEDWKEETNSKLNLLEKNLQTIVNKQMQDIFATISNLFEKKKKAPRGSKETVKRKALLGDYIKWLPTGEVGRVVRFTQTGNLRKIVLKLKNKSYIEVYDNIKMYDIFFEANK
jgi:hypothetical protein